MRSSRRTRPRTSLSLFPFLAVLICTMGVLIVLLVIVVKHADNSAQQVRREQVASDPVEPEVTAQPAEQVDLQPQLETLRLAKQKSELQIELLADVRDQVKADLAKKQQLRSNVQANINDLREQAAAMEKRLVRIENLDSETTEKTTQAERLQIAKLKQEIESAKKELAESSTASTKPSYAIVPFRGSGETNRRPIFVECTASAIILQPYGIQLTPADFQEPIIAGNPLDAALLTIRDYLHSNSTGQSSEQPYPLLIVRPDGAEGYAKARRAMKSWVDQFGYELIPADMQLSYPPPEPLLIAKIRQTVKAARIRSDAIRRAANRTVDLSMIASNQYGTQLRQHADLPGSPNGPGDLTRVQHPSQIERMPANFAGNKMAAPSELSAGQSPRNGFHHSTAQIRDTDSKRTRLGFSPTRNSEDTSTGSAGIGNQPTSVASLKPQNSVRGGHSSDSKAQAAGDSSRGTAATFASAGTGGNQQSQTESFRSSMSTHSSQSGATLAQSKGKDWALPSKQQKGTAYRRRIYLDCSSDQLLIKSAATESSRNTFISLTRETAYHLDELIDQVWNQVDSWGVAGQNSYWKPQLMIRVKQDGFTRATEIRTLLKDSGLDVQLINQ